MSKTVIIFHKSFKSKNQAAKRAMIAATKLTTMNFLFKTLSKKYNATEAIINDKTKSIHNAGLSKLNVLSLILNINKPQSLYIIAAKL